MPTSHPDRESVWRDTLARWKRSGLSITQFCRHHRLNLSNFQRWKNKLATAPDVATFVPVTIVSDMRAIADGRIDNLSDRSVRFETFSGRNGKSGVAAETS